jgi:hypothetical protein
MVGFGIVLGIWVGLWEAHFWVEGAGCPLAVYGVGARCIPPVPQPQFAAWVCALCGAGAMAMVALIALAVDRWPAVTDP